MIFEATFNILFDEEMFDLTSTPPPLPHPSSNYAIEILEDMLEKASLAPHVPSISPSVYHHLEGMRRGVGETKEEKLERFEEIKSSLLDQMGVNQNQQQEQEEEDKNEIIIRVENIVNIHPLEVGVSLLVEGVVLRDEWEKEQMDRDEEEKEDSLISSLSLLHSLQHPFKQQQSDKVLDSFDLNMESGLDEMKEEKEDKVDLMENGNRYLTQLMQIKEQEIVDHLTSLFTKPPPPTTVSDNQEEKMMMSKIEHLESVFNGLFSSSSSSSQISSHLSLKFSLSILHSPLPKLPPLFKEGVNLTQAGEEVVEGLSGMAHERICGEYEKLFNDLNEEEKSNTNLHPPTTVRMLLNCESDI